MFNLYSNEGDVLFYGGHTLELALYYDTVLAVFDLIKEDMTDFEKIVLMFQMLVVNADDYSEYFDIDDLVVIVNTIIEQLLGEEENNTDLPAYDFNYDAERIFSSFLQDYSINLREEQGHLKWVDFIALFHNLNENTPIMRAIYYRTCELPTGKENEEIRKDILTKRKIYELPQVKEARQLREIELLCREAELI